MIRILVVNGPNLNLLGRREPELYGTVTLQEIEEEVRRYAESQGAEVRFVQSNHEGALIEAIHAAMGWADAIVINPAGFGRSIALRDAISGSGIPTVEVHLTNIHKREPFRRHTLISEVVEGQISGFGLESYRLGIQAVLGLINRKQ
ncbi:MAG: type II 3-dehydroquinate dehydratase [Candidatus Methylomirabilales bacterium]